MNDTTPPAFVLLASGAARHSLLPDIQRWQQDNALRALNTQIEPSGDHLYLRVALAGDAPLNALRAAFAPVARNHRLLSWTIRDATATKRLVVMTSTKDHCLAELLARWRHNTLAGGVDVEIGMVVSNHPDVAGLVSSYGIPFRYIPVGSDKSPAEAELQGVLAVYRPDFVVLARYQQILGAGLCDQFAGKIVNVHPSLLPAFPGADPYQQAADAGVKVIGSTFHFVTAQLDQGPIIGQQTRGVAHLPVPDAKAYASVGRGAEIAVVADGMRLLLQDKVLLDGNRVVTFA